jgi:hypothetical protein
MGDLFWRVAFWKCALDVAGQKSTKVTATMISA